MGLKASKRCGEDGPRLIEVNTNAGGAFLNALLARAQHACCAVMEPPPIATGYSFEDADLAISKRMEAPAGNRHTIPDRYRR